MRAYLTSVTATALISALLLALVPEGSGKRNVRLGCGLLMVLAALLPLLELDYDSIAGRIADIQLQTEAARTGVEVGNRELQARIISERCGTYILDKAQSLGAALEVEVQTRDRGSGPYPYAVTLRGVYSEAAQTVLTRYIEDNLAIPAARQVWQCE